MKIDDREPDAVQATCAGDRQNRREFFNGLGKWSMIVVSAVSFLRGSGTRAQAVSNEKPGTEPEAQRPAWLVPNDDVDNRQIAKGPYVKGGGHVNDYLKWTDGHFNRAHVNHKIM
jgi:hypothetical protein